jgi:hypothetical protein
MAETETKARELFRAVRDGKDFDGDAYKELQDIAMDALALGSYGNVNDDDAIICEALGVTCYSDKLLPAATLLRVVLQP